MYNPEMFMPLPAEEKASAEVMRPSLTYWQDARKRLMRDPLAVLGLIVIAVILLMAVFGPMFSQYEYDAQDFMVSNEPPSMSHWFGTDMFGRDIFVRVLYGARISLAVGFLASFISLFIGVIYGGISGFVGGRTDNIMMSIVDVIYSVPVMIYVILLMVVVGPGLKSIFITLGISYWAPMARIVRAEVMRLKNEEFILAARVIGASSRRILLRHLIPNAMGSDAVPAMAIYPWQLFFPAWAISITILAFNFLGDGLRDALDPKLRK